MRNGDLIPPVETDRALYEAQRQLAAAHITYTACVSCKQEFSDENCFTQAGWQETQISGMCERCFDAATMESEDDEERCPDCGFLVCSCDDDECPECGRLNCTCDLDKDETWW